MMITREQVIDDLNKRTGYYKKDIKELLTDLDYLLEDYMKLVTEDEPVDIYILRGIKVTSEVIGEKTYIVPGKSEPVTKPTDIRLNAKVGETLKIAVKKYYYGDDDQEQ